MKVQGKILVLGSHGQLGRELAALLPAEHSFLATRSDADLAIAGQVESLVHRLQPSLVINCAAYNLVDQAEKSPDDAWRNNAIAVRELAKACASCHATLVHFSTDYVFGLDTARKEPYSESDAPGPLSTYGISKLAGEYFARAFCPSHLIIRTCGLYGHHGAGGKGTNFVETMLKLAKSGKTIRVVNDQILTPSSASDLATAACSLIQSEARGLYHVTNAGECSWFEFAQAIFDLSEVQADLQPISSKEYGSLATRPGYSVLRSQHASLPALPDWKQALQNYLASRTTR